CRPRRRASSRRVWVSSRLLSPWGLSLFTFGLGFLLGRFRLFRRRGLFRRSAVVRLGARQHRRLPFGAFRGDDDRVRQALRAALVAQDLVGLSPAGALECDLLQLVLELFLRELAALQPCTRLDDLFDVELENITPAELALGPFALS